MYGYQSVYDAPHFYNAHAKKNKQFDGHNESSTHKFMGMRGVPRAADKLRL